MLNKTEQLLIVVLPVWHPQALPLVLLLAAVVPVLPLVVASVHLVQPLLVPMAVLLLVQLIHLTVESFTTALLLHVVMIQT